MQPLSLATADDQESLVLASPRDIQATPRDGQQCSKGGQKSLKSAGVLGALLLVGAAIGVSHFAFQGNQGNPSASTNLAAAPDAVVTLEDGYGISKKFFEEFPKMIFSKDATGIMELFADETEWDWSGDVHDKGTPADLFDGPTSVFGAGWGMMLSDFTPSNFFTTVDTGSGVICTSFDTVMTMSGHGAVPIDSKSNVFNPNAYFEFHVNGDGKIKYWKARWNTMNPATGVAVANLMKAWDKPMPPAPPAPVVTVEEGVAIAKELCQWVSTGFNQGHMNLESAQDLMTDNMHYEWPGVSEDGSPKDMVDKIEGSWQTFLSAEFQTNLHICVDPQAGHIYVNHQKTLFIDADGKLPVDDKSIYVGNFLFEYHVEKVDGKVKSNYFRALYDTLDPKMGAALGAAMAALKQ